MSDTIRVVCRLRPLNKIQIANSGQQCVTYSDKQIQINVGGQQSKYSFTFDKIFGPTTQQVSIYKEVAIPIIKSVTSGFNGTIFAYGQTGGGKTWTMEGPNHHDAEFKGLIPRTIEGLFESIASSDESLEFVIKCSYVEIYNQKLFDLLDPSKAKLQIKEDRQRGIFIQNCTELSVSSAENMLRTMDTGSQNRKVAFTGMNERSSRSHSLFVVHLFQKNLKKDITKQSKLYFVDLAGSEKVSKTGVMGQQLEEAKNINKSLSALGNVINALTSEKKEHVPYRDSKLTRILQESLGGNSKTTLIINCSMCTYNDKQTLSTLRFGYRAKSIKNKPKVNEEKSVKQLLLLLDEANKTISELRIQLKLPSEPNSMQNKENEEQDEKSQMILQLKDEIEQNKKDEEERTKQMELRIKQLILQLSKQKEENSLFETKWSSIFMKLRQFVSKLNKQIRRSYVDMEFCLNNIILSGKSEIQNANFNNSKETVTNMLKNIEEYEEFYKKEVQPIMNDILQQSEMEDIQQFQSHLLTSDKRKAKIAQSQPVLHIDHEIEVQLIGKYQRKDSFEIMSYNGQSKQSAFEDIGGDKNLQNEQFFENETALQSQQTKESQRQAIQDMEVNIKQLKKQNEQLSKKLQTMEQQRESFAVKLQQKYNEQILQLDAKIQQYKTIMHKKDIELTKSSQQVEQITKLSMQQRTQLARLKQIMQANNNFKIIQQLEDKVKSLVNQRQKIFKELYMLREQFDQAQISLNQKDQLILSLKQVTKQLSQNAGIKHNYTREQISKTYNAQVFGTVTPNVVQIVKGGKKQSSPKKSNLRKKTQGAEISSSQKNETQKKGMNMYVDYIKSFWN